MVGIAGVLASNNSELIAGKSNIIDGSHSIHSI